MGRIKQGGCVYALCELDVLRTRIGPHSQTPLTSSSSSSSSTACSTTQSSTSSATSPSNLSSQSTSEAKCETAQSTKSDVTARVMRTHAVETWSVNAQTGERRLVKSRELMYSADQECVFACAQGKGKIQLCSAFSW